ncbi:hypothetical protein GUJ93_ZPchr0002g26093 [Zizania palustris]|uniref:RING-type domain-containing protein n=1 Tax=Zizania palustris TaxID=103762 RepID=A0A8J5VEX5_ZIZPA|nr:hypothetical protein GUJ93_ZPchr0002g26093 [Zizania palustris]
MEAMPPRRGVTLAQQLAASSNLRDLLKLRDDEEGGEGHGGHQHMAAAAAGRRRTLLDVIRGVGDDNRAVSPQSSGVGGRRSARTMGTVDAPRAAAAAGAQAGRVSLMALLEQAELQWATGGGEWRRVEEDAASEERRNKGCATGRGGVGGRCCVCMARGKAAAFIPCGHTFCRACARELRSGRGRCPLCNAAIHDVLNLF